MTDCSKHEEFKMKSNKMTGYKKSMVFLFQVATVLSYSLSGFSGTKAMEFERLESHTDDRARLELLLSSRSDSQNFTIHSETATNVKCLYTSQYHGKTNCDKQVEQKTKTYFAESDSKLCKVENDVLKCVNKSL
jgi:hypothetical protein